MFNAKPLTAPDTFNVSADLPMFHTAVSSHCGLQIQGKQNMRAFLGSSVSSHSKYIFLKESYNYLSQTLGTFFHKKLSNVESEVI